MSGPRIALDLWGYSPGQTVGGHVQPGSAALSLRIDLVFGDQTIHSQQTRQVEGSTAIHEGPFAPDTWVRFDLPLPADALPSFRSEHGDVFWAVEAADGAPDGFGIPASERFVVARPGAHQEGLRHPPEESPRSRLLGGRGDFAGPGIWRPQPDGP